MHVCTHSTLYSITLHIPTQQKRGYQGRIIFLTPSIIEVMICHTLYTMHSVHRAMVYPRAGERLAYLYQSPQSLVISSPLNHLQISHLKSM